MYGGQRSCEKNRSGQLGQGSRIGGVERLVFGKDPHPQRIACVLLKIGHVVVFAAKLNAVLAGNDAVGVAELRPGLIAYFVEAASPGQRRKYVRHPEAVDASGGE